ncbi:MAG: arginine--tRNA ligase [Bacteroidales bacterium]
MILEENLKESVCGAARVLYNTEIDINSLQIQETRKEFDGELTLVTFPLIRILKQKPEEIGNALGHYLVENIDSIKAFNVVKGFLNVSFEDSIWHSQLADILSDDNYGNKEITDSFNNIMVEFSSPNTNKPLHLGHIRNNLLGDSICRILKANGNKVIRTNIVNDRGIHICKSMYAWMKYGNGETPQSAGKKGDHLVGDYYVKFDAEYKRELTELKSNGMSEDESAENTESMKAVRELLRKWEGKDPEVYALWQKMNAWVYEGFDKTYQKLGITFDKIYYESDTYLEGKDEVIRGLHEGLFVKHSDGSVWANLEAEGLDQKILLRSDGTSVYMTQDIGTAKLRYQDYKINKMVYVVGNEQDYHFKVLSILLNKLGFEWGSSLFHFSYGMVELPHGKMKSREGTVVDADDLMEEMIKVAKATSDELGKLEGLSEEEAYKTYEMIALGALKYFILKVDPKKKMMFNPTESIDFNGNTGPFIQYTYARICSVLRKAEEMNISNNPSHKTLEEKEKMLIVMLTRYANIINEAALSYSPALIANYCYDVAKAFNAFYHDYSILNVDDNDIKIFRISLSKATGNVLKSGMNLLGIMMPERM